VGVTEYRIFVSEKRLGDGHLDDVGGRSVTFSRIFKQ
jgi:hypothetical protein